VGYFREMKSSKISLLVFLGIFFWFVAAMTVRLLGNSVFSDQNVYLPLMFIAAFPITYIFMLITLKFVSLNKSEILNAVVIITITATFLDGIAMTRFRQVYAESFEIAFNGAAWILWGVGVGLLFGFLISDSREKEKV
jgi:hypothetical protein